MPAVVRPDVIFVHIPKSGGTSIGTWLEGPVMIGHPRMEDLLPYKTNQVTFTVVRNPWDRAVSAYHYLFCTEKETTFQSYIDKGKPTFEEFIKNLGTVTTQEVWFNGLNTQCDWIRGGVDHILKFENLEEDFKIIQNITGNFKPLPHLNKSNHKNYREYFTPETRDIIAQVFKEDIERFNYVF